MRRHKPLARTPLNRTGRLRRTKGPRRTVSIRPRNRQRRRQRFAVAYGSEERVAWTQAQPCIVPGCTRKPSEMAHVVSRAAGGTADDTVSLCGPHHRLQHQLGVQTFAAYFALDLTALAASLARAWDER